MLYTRRRWTQTEDEALKELVSIYGAKNWKEISLHVPGRNDKQCRERWMIYLSPDIRKEDFSLEEDDVLKLLVERIGKKWTTIASYFTGRAPETLKTRYSTLMRRQKTDEKRQRERERIQAELDKRRMKKEDLTDQLFSKFETIDLTKE